MHFDDLRNGDQNLTLLISIEEEVSTLQGVEDRDTPTKGQRVHIHLVVLRPISRSENIHQEGDAKEVDCLGTTEGLRMQTLSDHFFCHVTH